MSKGNGEFDSNRYWEDRHEQFQRNSQGVGNVSLSQEENDKIYEHARKRMGKIVDVLDLRNDASILDLGCGIGLVAEPFIARGFNYTGVDISETAIDLARETHSSATFLCADISKLELNKRFDLILERTVLIHLTDELMWQETIGVVKRHLASNGIFIIQDHLTPERESPSYHVTFRSLEDYKVTLDAHSLAFSDEIAARVLEHVPAQNLNFVIHKR